MANKITNTQHYQDIADAIRTKNGSSDTYTPAQMAQAIEDLPAAENTELMALLAGTAIGDVTVKGVTNLLGTNVVIGGSASASPNRQLTILRMPDLVVWGDILFDGGIRSLAYQASYDNFRELHIPKCEAINLTGTELNNVTTRRLLNLQIIDAPKLKALYGGLYGSGLINADFPELETIQNNYTFCSCTSLKTATLPKVRTLMGNMFKGCTALETAILKNCVPSASYCFQDCSSLELCDLGGTASGRSIGYNTFYNCTSLVALVLRSTTMIGLAAVGNLGNTPIANGTGYVYVPRDLISTYEAATNWSTYAGQFRAIEDYTDDGTLTGNFVMPT